MRQPTNSWQQSALFSIRLQNFKTTLIWFYLFIFLFLLFYCDTWHFFITSFDTELGAKKHKIKLKHHNLLNVLGLDYAVCYCFCYNATGSLLFPLTLTRRRLTQLVSFISSAAVTCCRSQRSSPLILFIKIFFRPFIYLNQIKIFRCSRDWCLFVFCVNLMELNSSLMCCLCDLIVMDHKLWCSLNVVMNFGRCIELLTRRL